MGYFTDKIAKEKRTPNIVSLSNNPNYIEFEKLDKQTDKKVSISLKIVNIPTDLTKTAFSITEVASNVKHDFRGTNTESEINNNTFNLNATNNIVLENIKACLLSIDFFKSNFNISIPFINDGGEIKNGDTLKIESLGSGVNYAFNFENLNSEFIKLVGSPSNTITYDSIIGTSKDCEIEIDIYKDTNVFLGSGNNDPSGTYIGGLSKSYNGAPIWFDVNKIPNDSKGVQFSFGDGWQNTNTLIDYRFIARKNDGVNRSAFYISDVLYSLNGYTRDLEDSSLIDYIYDTRRENIVKPLTKQPILTHVNGQTQYFNFILSDPYRSINLGKGEFDLGIIYKVYSQSKKLLNTIIIHKQKHKLFNVANFIKLDLDSVIGDIDAGYVEVSLCRNLKQVSEPLEFRILPKCLYSVNDFVFLNSLGGWSSFNFGGAKQTEFTSSSNTVLETQTPNHNISSTLNKVQSKEIDEAFTVQTMPIDRVLCNWLQELSASPVVYELSTQRYIIVNELNIKHSTKEELFILEMKYTYSDTYNAAL